MFTDPYKELGLSYHPVMMLPSVRQMAEMGKDEFEQFVRDREKLIAKEKHDPLRYGYEPPIWWVCDCLLGFDWVDKEEARKVREHLHFEHALKILMINGGNRGGKTQYSTRTFQKIMAMKKSARCWAFQMSEQRSVADLQPYIWQYMTPEWRALNPIREEQCYITYKAKTGFGEGSFIAPNKSWGEFKNYKMDKTTAIEGGETDFIHFDELVPPDWVDTALYRIATRNGRIVVSFTPVNGYSPTVRVFRDGATTVKSSVAYLLPKDGADPDEAKALGLSDEEAQEVFQAIHDDRMPRNVPCRPEDCRKWLDEEQESIDEKKDSKKVYKAPDGRTFETVPRVQKCFQKDRAIVYFYSADNPFGGAANVISTGRNDTRAKKLERFYGYADRAHSLQFPKFNRDVHMIPDSAIPEGGTNYFFKDPAGGRKFYMKWYKVTRDNVYLYREWPGDYEIPGCGFPGPWAVPDGDKVDGKKGEGQDDLGWGLKHYKQEIARLEAWDDYKDGEWPQETISQWDPNNGSKEPIELRYMDSRAASNPRQEKDRPTTLLTDFEELGMNFELTPGMIESEGIVMINDALYYDDSQPVSYFNRPRFLIAESCTNSIFAYETYTGTDGQKAACKDPIDLDRYFFLSECDYVDPSVPVCEGGGSL